MVLAISNWFDARLVLLFNMPVSPGTLSFPITYLLSDTITEVYGYKNARQAIWAAFFFNVLFLLYGQLIIHLPSPSFATDNAAFNKLMAMNKQIILASFASYLIAEPINAFIIAKLKIWTRGHFMGIRFVGSTLVATMIDTVLFIFLAYYSHYSGKELVSLMLNGWLVKVSVEILGLPFSIGISKWLKAKEKLDIYDYQTKFTPFSLDTEYKVENNLYQQRV
jgi:hypothetical protein